MKHLLVAYAVTLAGVWTMHADGPALEEGFVSLFNGKDLTGWVGATDGYQRSVQDLSANGEVQGGVRWRQCQ